MKKILYIGGFEMPDGNAAAQRVLSVAKSLKENFEITFLGITHGSNFSGVIDGFYYTNLPYPSSKKDWIDHLDGAKELVYIKNSSPDIVISYNFPAIGLYRINRYCKKRGIKIVGDITEWYQPHNLPKWLDTTWRMTILNKKMEGLILISNYLKEYYTGTNSIQMPPTVDPQDKKWGTKSKLKEKELPIILMYAGSPGRGDKDRLDNLVECIGNYPNMILKVVGITAEKYNSMYPDIEVPQNVTFYGRQNHDTTIAMLNESDFSVFFRRSSRVNNAGFPTKFVEAQMAGIPVITSKFSDLAQYIHDGKNGYMAAGIDKDEVNAVLKKVSSLTLSQIKMMHEFTKSQNLFDYHLYAEQLTAFIDNL